MIARMYLLLFVGCGVEETGFLTGEGVYFTEDLETETQLLVVRPEAVKTLTGDLSGETNTGERLESRVLEATGTAWAYDRAEEVTLSYTFYGDVDEATYSVAINEGTAPGIAGLIRWVTVSGGALEVQPSALDGSLPFLVVNQTNGASVVVATDEPATLMGAAGDRVCAASLIDTTATASVCVTVPEN